MIITAFIAKWVLTGMVALGIIFVSLVVYLVVRSTKDPAWEKHFDAISNDVIASNKQPVLDTIVNISANMIVWPITMTKLVMDIKNLIESVDEARAREQELSSEEE